MADFSSYDTTNSPSGPEKPRVFGLKVLNDIDLLRRTGLGDAPTLVAGYLQLFEDGSNRIYGKVVRADGSTVKEAMVGEYFLREDLDFDGQTALKFRVEDAAPLALSAAADGQISRDPGNRRLVKNGPSGGKRHYLSEFDIDGGSFKRIKCNIASTSTAAAVVRDDIDGYMMDDAADEIRYSASKPLPADYTGNDDVLLELLVRIEGVELSTDTIDMQTDMEKASIGTETFDGTTTNYTDTGVQLGVGGTAAGTIHRVLIPLDYADGTNPLASDDKIRGVLKRNGLALVGDVVVTEVNLLVPCYGGVDYQ